MYYKIYGVGKQGAFTTLLGSAKSLKQALHVSAAQIDSNIYPIYAITEHARKHSVATGINAGYTGGPLLKSTMLCACKPNPCAEKTDYFNHF